MVTIYLEDNELDVKEDFSNQITYQIDDIKNLDSKATSFSKTIVIPGTVRNNKIFGNIFEFSNSNFYNSEDSNSFYNFNASKSASARLDINGLTIIKGVIRLLQIVIDKGSVEYEVAIFGELGGFVSALGNKKLEDLDFSEFNQSYSISNITNSWDSSGCVFPLIDYGLSSSNKIDYQYKSLRPAFFVKDYINKIITDAGYTYECSFFDTNFFKSLIIPYNRKTLTRRSSAGFNVETKRHTYNSGFTPGVPDIVQIDIQYDKTIAIGDFNANAGYNTFTYTSATALVGKLEVFVSFGYTKPTADALEYILYLNGNPIISTTIGDGFSSGNVAQLFTIDSITINNGDVLNAVVNGQTSGSAGFTLRYVNSSFGNNNFIKISAAAVYDVPVNINEEIIANDTLPQNIFQKDFFSSIIKMFYLMITEDKFKEKHLVIKPWVDFYNLSTSAYLDWSDKIDRSQAIKIKPMSEINARFYNLNYKSDSDFFNEDYKKKYNEGYGNVIFDNQLDFAKDSSTTEVVFSATPLVGYSGTDKIVSTIFKKQNNSTSTSVEEQISVNIRILQYQKLTGFDDWDILDEFSSLGTYDVFPYAGHLDNPNNPSIDLNFGAVRQLYFDLQAGTLSNNLFNVYYSSYMAEITDKDSRLVTAKIKLTEKDIFNLDFGRFIWLDGVLYRLYKINDYSEGEICEVELLRVIYTTYELPGEGECIQAETLQCLQTEDDYNLTIETI
ncbi:hypothetical protein UFOVP215_33 [uncultured Caudovirales phage]|uniref:Uncharacterized protein n=1 Tax=uncultured Caudovirales phage TaxID=2100421 RepID=A0A6J7WLX6_9CAUD|nr:hypothetical protein UFOVP215_33 [uncultured Caudovirales phage]